MAPLPKTIDETHRTILKTAADIANMALIGQSYVPGQKVRGAKMSGRIFRADPIVSEKGGLCLSLDESVTQGKSTEEILELHYIGREAVKEAITQWHPDLFAGLILGSAKQGKNYFDRFEKEVRSA